MNLIVSASLAAILTASALGAAATTDVAPAVPPPVDAWCALGGIRPGHSLSRAELGEPKAGSGLLAPTWSSTFYPNLTCMHPVGQTLELRPGSLSSS